MTALRFAEVTRALSAVELIDYAASTLRGGWPIDREGGRHRCSQCHPEHSHRQRALCMQTHICCARRKAPCQSMIGSMRASSEPIGSVVPNRKRMRRNTGSASSASAQVCLGHSHRPRAACVQIQGRSLSFTDMQNATKLHPAHFGLFVLWAYPGTHCGTPWTHSPSL